MTPLRAQYSRLRTQAQHRLTRLRVKGIETQADFPKLKGMSEHDVEQALENVKNYLSSGDSLAKRQQKQRAERKAHERKPQKPKKEQGRNKPKPQKAKEPKRTPLDEISKAQKANYTKMRDIAHKRIQRLHAKGLGKEYSDFKKLSEMQSPEEFQRAYDELTAFLLKDVTVASERRRKQQSMIDAFKQSGFNITPDELPHLSDFMEFWRELSISAQYASDQAVALFDHMYKMGINPDDIKKDFDTYLDHRDEILALPEQHSNGKKWSSSALLNALNERKSRE